MDVASAAAVHRAITTNGLAGASEPELLRLFCEALLREGLTLSRANLLIDTLHPVYEGRVFRWRRDDPQLAPVVEYGRTNVAGSAQESWRRSTFYHLLQTGESLLRCRLAMDPRSDFPILDELRAEGQTDHVVLINRFSSEGALGEMDGVYSSWTTDHPDGFTDKQVQALEELVPSLALAIKCVSLTRVAETLVETYLGRDAGRRVLSGRIERGIADRIAAVLWYSDLRQFTRVADQVEPELLIPFLNDYADAVISSIHEAGGDVLKLIGDGTLAVFQADDPQDACACALQARRLAQERLEALNQDRLARGLPITTAYLGLHIGEVFYGNIGSKDRLDFTVVGPAVNEVSRIAEMCRSAERQVLLSPAFCAAAAPEERASFVSVGRYALRGVACPQELYTIA
jgi:adenylate cyclase